MSMKVEDLDLALEAIALDINAMDFGQARNRIINLRTRLHNDGISIIAKTGEE